MGMEGASEEGEGEESPVRLRVGLKSEEERPFIYNEKERGDVGYSAGDS